MNFRKYFGPSTLVTAAFIGPGSVTLCSMTGAATGYSLLWVLVFSVFTTIVFQEMAARLGLVTQQGLGEAIANAHIPYVGKLIMIIVSFSAIIIGNAAYEAGNLAGAALGLEIVFEGFKLWPLILGAIAAVILYIGQYAILEKLLIGLVILMSSCFVFTAIMVQPSLSEIAAGFVPGKADFKDILLIIGLIGTTVVPYNLFLHASSIGEKYKSVDQLKDVRRENFVAIALGGIISMAIVITSAKVYGGTNNLNNISDFAKQLEPLLGNYATIVMAIGFFAAGLSSAITAPLAAAYAARGLFGFSKDLKDPRFRLVWGIILCIGIALAMIGYKPVHVIKFAQVANGIILPVIAGFLLYIVNSRDILGEYVNSKGRNIISIIVLLATISISIRTMLNVFGG